MAKLYLRLIASCPDQSALQLVQAAATRELAAWNAEEAQAAATYWKLPKHFELSFTIAPGTDAIHRAITGLEPFGWDTRNPDKDASNVWNKSGDRCFIESSVVRAELGFLDER